MKAAIYKRKAHVDVQDVPVPECGPEDVLVEVSHCGICGTDLHMVMDGWGRRDSIGGHEYAGTVHAVGTDVPTWRVGDRVVAQPQIEGCGTCRYCERDRPSLCTGRGKPGVDAFQGAFAEFVRVDHRQLVRVPDGLPLRSAALCEPLAVAQHAVTLSQVEPGARALVSGAGPIGAMITAILRAGGLDVVVSEPGEKRRRLAQRLGATAIDPSALVPPPLPFDSVDAPFDVAFECSGKGAAVEACLAQLARGGHLVLVGTGIEHPPLDANRVLLNELTITGAFNYDARGFEHAIELLTSGRIPVDLLLESNDVPLEGLVDAMKDLTSGARAGKVLVRLRRGTQHEESNDV